MSEKKCGAIENNRNGQQYTCTRDAGHERDHGCQTGSWWHCWRDSDCTGMTEQEMRNILAPPFASVAASEAMGEDERWVRGQWPNALLFQEQEGAWAIFFDHNQTYGESAWANTEADAWQKAARRLGKPQPPSEYPLSGCDMACAGVDDCDASCVKEPPSAPAAPESVGAELARHIRAAHALYPKAISRKQGSAWYVMQNATDGTANWIGTGDTELQAWKHVPEWRQHLKERRVATPAQQPAEQTERETSRCDWCGHRENCHRLLNGQHTGECTESTPAHPKCWCDSFMQPPPAVPPAPVGGDAEYAAFMAWAKTTDYTMTDYSLARAAFHAGALAAPQLHAEQIRAGALEEAARAADADLLEIPGVLVAAEERFDGGSSAKTAKRIAERIRALGPHPTPRETAPADSALECVRELFESSLSVFPDEDDGSIPTAALHRYRVACEAARALLAQGDAGAKGGK